MTERAKEIISATEKYEYPMPLCVHSFAKTLVDYSDFTRIVTDLCDEIEQLKKANEIIIDDYKRRLVTINKEIQDNFEQMKCIRLEAKRSCYRAIIRELSKPII